MRPRVIDTSRNAPGWRNGTGPNDPVHGIRDATAGARFRQTALQMANNAIPGF